MGDRYCNIEPPVSPLRHHAEGSPLPRREQWARQGRSLESLTPRPGIRAQNPPQADKTSVAKYPLGHVRMHLLCLFQPLVAEVAGPGALHDGLRARELYVGTKSLGHREVGTADQQEAELQLA
jgi:hypothetical protein